MYGYSVESREVSFSAAAFWGNLFGTVLFAVAAGYLGAMNSALLSPFAGILWLVEFAMLFVMSFMRRRKSISYATAYSFTGLSGLVTGVAIGANPVYMHVVGISALETIGLFAVLSVIAIATGQVFLRMGTFLYAMLIALIIVDLISFFAFRTPADQVVLSSIGGLLFCGFVLYDIQRAYKKRYAETVPMLVVNVYLDLLNLFMSILNLNAFFSKK